MATSRRRRWKLGVPPSQWPAIVSRILDAGEAALVAGMEPRPGSCGAWQRADSTVTIRVVWRDRERGTSLTMVFSRITL